MLKGYMTADAQIAVERLAIRLRPALNRFIAYLRRTPDMRNRPNATRRDRRGTRKGKRTSAARDSEHPDSLGERERPAQREAKPSRLTRER
jgi:hypothetical protein